MAVFVLGQHKKPFMLCSEKRARLLLARGRARVHRLIQSPFGWWTARARIRFCSLCVSSSTPGSKTTGIALVREAETMDADTREIRRRLPVLMLLELHHRGHGVRDALTQRRAFRRRRPARFNNRTQPHGGLAPSLQHRVNTPVSWVNRLRRWVPVTALSQELVRFDMQQMQNPEIGGVAYQQGTLAGYEVREYLLEKWDRRCAYCGAANGPLEVDHIHPRSRGGSDG